MSRPKKTEDNTNSSSSFGKNEKLWLTYKTEKGNYYYITSDVFRYNYYLYEKLKNGDLVKTKHKADNPTDLYEFMKE